MTNEVIITNDEFYISYMAKRSDMAKMMDEFVHQVLGEREPKELPETALCVRDSAKLFGVRFYILYGDHREAYKAIASNGVKACIDYFIEHINQIGHSSDVPPTND